MDEDELAWLIEAQKFIRQQQRLLYARVKRNAVEAMVNADRYMRRATTLPVKALKASLKGLWRLLEVTPFPVALFNFRSCPNCKQQRWGTARG